MHYAEQHEKDANSYLEQNNKLKRQLAKQKDAFDVRQSSQKRDQQKLHTNALTMKDTRLKELKTLVRDKGNHIVQIENANNANANRADVNQKALMLTIMTENKQRDFGKLQQMQASMWRDRYNKLTQQLLEEECSSDELATELDEWRNIAKEMQGKYEQTINAKSALKINKVWVRNQGMIDGRQKKGELLIVSNEYKL